MACFASRSAQFALPNGSQKNESSITSIKDRPEPTTLTTLKKRLYHEKFQEHSHIGKNMNSDCLTGRSFINSEEPSTAMSMMHRRNSNQESFTKECEPSQPKRKCYDYSHSQMPGMEIMYRA